MATLPILALYRGLGGDDGKLRPCLVKLASKVLHRDNSRPAREECRMEAQEVAPNWDSVPLSTGHGNQKESSPFLCPMEASRGNDYCDRNLALFEVIEEPFWATDVVGRWAGRDLSGPKP